jgi:peptidoglycan/LPS O-acetylase OafA/YrhL
MDSLQRNWRKSFAARRNRLIWPALVLFLVGGAICSFNPSADVGQQSIRGEQNMKSQSAGQANQNTDLQGGAASPEAETATFALG